MFYSPQVVKDHVADRVRHTIQEIPIISDVADPLTAQIVAGAIDVRLWSEHQLVSIKHPKNTLTSLHLMDEGAHVPSVVYYSPRAAAQIVLSIIGALLGETNALLVGITVVTLALGLKDFRTVATPGEGLLFWLIFDREGHHLDRGVAKESFDNQAPTFGVVPGDFESALASLKHLDCIRESGQTIEVSDRMILHWKQ